MVEWGKYGGGVIGSFVQRVVRLWTVLLLASVVGGCAPSGPSPIGPSSVDLLGVATVHSLHPMTGEPVGGFSGLTYDPVAEAWLVVSNRVPDSVAYTLRTSYDPRAESAGQAWVAGAFEAWLGREWPVPGEAEDAEAVAIRRTAAGSHQRFWAFEREPTILIEDLRSGAVRTLPIPTEVTQHYRFDAAFKGLALVPERIGDRLWVAMGAPLTVDQQRYPSMLRILSFPADGTGEPTSGLYSPQISGAELAALATIPESNWRDALPVFALETGVNDESRRTLRLMAIQGTSPSAGQTLPTLAATEVADLTEVLTLADGPLRAGSYGLAIGPRIADRRGGRIVLIVTTSDARTAEPRHTVYALRIALD